MFRHICFVLAVAITSSLGAVSTTSADELPVVSFPGETGHAIVTSWLVSTPLPSPGVANASPGSPQREGYTHDFLGALGGETAARITPETTIELPDGENATFSEHSWEGPYVDLRKFLGSLAYVCVYMYTEIECAEPQEVYIHIGTNDAGKTWVGGQLVMEYPSDRGAERSQHVVHTTLPAGHTPVLMKVDQAGGGWGAFFEIMTPDANRNYVVETFPRVLRISADTELPRIGQTMNLTLSNVPAWPEDFDATCTWTVQDGETTTPIEATGPNATLVVPPGPSRDIIVNVSTTHPAGGEAQGMARFYVSNPDDDPYMPRVKPDHVVLTLGDNAEVDRRVAWRTATSVETSTAQIVASDETDLSSIDWSDSETVNGTNTAGDSNLGEYRAHEVTFTGLTPGDRYVYRVGNGEESGWSDPAAFNVPDVSESIIIGLLGDTRTQMDVWDRQVHAVAEFNPSFIVNTGDLISNGLNMDDWNRWLHPARDVFATVPTMPTLGNHERNSPIYYNTFALPTNGPEGLEEQVYSFDMGPTHWVCLNSCGNLNDQTEWLEDDLEENTKPWVFVFYHHPAYAGHASRGDGNESVRAAICEILDRYHVAIAWQGHDHYYFRTHPIRNREVVDWGQGTLYITAGGGGAPLYDFADNQWRAVAETTHHYIRIDATEEELNVKTYRIDGSLLEEFSLSK